MKNHRPRNRCCLSVMIGTMCLLAAPCSTVSGQPTAPSEQLLDAEARFHEFEAQLAGTATATRRRMLEELRRDLEGEVVLVSGSIYNLSEISLEPAATAIPDWGVAFFSWEHDGLLLKRPTASPDGLAVSPRDQVKAQLGAVDSATLVILQGDGLKLYGLTSDQRLIDDLRSGVELHVKVFITGLQGNSLFGFLIDFAEPEAELGCSQGHRFEVSTGFVYCPFCGEKLTESANFEAQN